MSVRLGRAILVIMSLAPLLCVSCLSMNVPKTAQVEPNPTSSGTVTEASLDKSLADTWELLYQVNDKGDQERPRDATRTVIEFTDKGQVIFNRMDKENSEAMKSRTGKYSLEKSEISITDDVGNTVKWPYQITGDQLVIFMPEVNKKFYWRRFR
ncbi:MAG: lipocalin family protein [Desulfomonile tiedjei]|uniref:Lipocalin family protein n=1 Tax=Desulfomonile tiedjei TaxID=2358 RepID=A0A9D6UZN1_9BACT|nr:lipocalin family protein [Desulfomonile tiedjei]